MPASYKKILRITLAWVLISLAEFGHTYSALTAQGCHLPAGTAGLMLLTSVLSAILAGVVGGSVIVFFFQRWLRHRPYGKALLGILLTFSLIFFGVSLFSGVFVNSMELDLPFWHPKVIGEIWDFFANTDTIRSYLFWLFVVLITNITLLVDEKYGPGVFREFLLGRYFRPRREERIFMFLDLRGSTALAEQLGEEIYFQLIQELFRDATPAILRHRGQIYQYVGDEIIVSWPLAEGVSQGRCIECFLAIQRKLRERSDYYQQKFGIQPEFKAGLHYGYVMAGEVGVVKREIAFSGDVLNTTARIQSKCNELGVNVLISDTLFRVLPERIQAAARALGSFPLRGKAEEVTVYTV